MMYCAKVSEKPLNGRKMIQARVLSQCGKTLVTISLRDRAKAQQLMDHRLADIEGRVRLTEGQGDRHTFLAVLENFS